MVQLCGLLVLAATAALARSSPLASEPALRLAVPPAERLQDAGEVLLGLPVGVASSGTPPRHRFSPAPAAPAAPRALRADEDAYRLPTALQPTRYQLALTVDMKALTFSGSVSIALNVVADTDTIVLHAADNLDIGTIEVKSADKDLVVKAIERSTLYQTVTITLAETLQKGAHCTLSFPGFSSKLSTDLSGFYLSSYVNQDGATRYLATTQFESTSARKAFPCFDEPSLKARFDITITHDKESYGVRSNMPQTLPSSETETTRTTTFTSTVPMSTYLLAWVVSDFEKLSNDDETFNTWARKEIVQGAGMSQEVGPKALEELGKYLGIPYALPKTDQFAIPDFSAGAMENWGLVTYREEYLIQTESTDVRYEQEIATVICHELSHQWTGNLVTMDWWSNTWLNEGFATFFENFICDKIKPKMNLIPKSIVSYAHVAMTNDLIETQHAMSSPVSTPDEIEGKFDRISYSKGGTVIRMFQHVLTPAVFEKGLTRYLSTSMFQNGTPEKLFRALSAEAVAANAKVPNTVYLPDGVDFAAVAKSWTEQAGVPVVKASCDFVHKQCTLTQQQLRPASSTATTRKWYIPITLITSKSTDSSSTKTIAWLTPSMQSLTVDIDIDEADQKSWVIINPQQTGYYRVSYDAASRSRILAALLDAENAETLNAATRVQYLSDALGLAGTEQLDWTQTAMALQTLKDSEDSAVWLAGYNVISALANELANTDVYSSFLIILNKITESAFRSTGLRVKADDDHNTRHVRYYAAAYACAAGNADCLKEAGELTKALLEKTEFPHVDVAQTVLCYGVKASDKAVFDQVKQDLWQATTGTTRSSVAGALACSSSRDLVTGLLTELLAKASPSQQDKTDMKDLLRALTTQQPAHHRAVLDFLKTNWQKMDTFFGDKSSVSTLVSSFIGTIRTTTEYAEVQQWARATLAGRDDYATIQGSLTATQQRLQGWYSKNYQKVASYIYEQTGTTPPPTPSTTSSPGSSTSGPTKGPTSAPGGGSTTPKPNGAALSSPAGALLALALLVAALVTRS